jgi:hypothetical protein
MGPDMFGFFYLVLITVVFYNSTITEAGQNPTDTEVFGLELRLG